MELPDQERNCRACMTVEQLMERARALVSKKKKSSANEASEPFSTNGTAQIGPSTSSDSVTFYFSFCVKII